MFRVICMSFSIRTYRNRQKRRHRSSLLFRGRNSFNSALQIYHQTQTTTTPKMDVLPITFLQIFLAAKWLVRHSSTSTFPKQQRRPLPSLVSVSSFIYCPLPIKGSRPCSWFEDWGGWNRTWNFEKIFLLPRGSKLLCDELRYGTSSASQGTSSSLWMYRR